MPRRVRLIVFLGIVGMLVLATGISAGASPEDEIRATEAEIADAQERLMEIRTEQSAALAAYNNALHEMNELNGKIKGAEEDLTAAEKRLAEAEEDLQERAALVYKSGNGGFIDVLVGTDNFSEFATRLDLWTRMLAEEREEYEAVLEAKEDLEERKTTLETQRVRRVEAVDEALTHKEDATEAETEAESYLNSLNGELQAAIEAEQEREAAAARAAAAEELPQPEPAPEPEPQPEPVAEPEPEPEPDPEAEAAAAEAERQAQLAAERAARAEEQ